MKKLVNPFVYFSGGTTLCAGLVVMAAMVVIACVTGQTFRGLVSFGLGDLAWWILALQLVGGWALFSLVLYGAARIFSVSDVRLVDIAGYQALAKLPCLFMMLGVTALPLRELAVNMENLNLADIENMLPMGHIAVVGTLLIALLVWFFAWSWKGFSIAANLRGAKGAGIYILCYLLTEIICTVLSFVGLLFSGAATAFAAHI